MQDKACRLLRQNGARLSLGCALVLAAFAPQAQAQQQVVNKDGTVVINATFMGGLDTDATRAETDSLLKQLNYFVLTTKPNGGVPNYVALHFNRGQEHVTSATYLAVAGTEGDQYRVTLPQNILANNAGTGTAQGLQGTHGILTMPAGMTYTQYSTYTTNEDGTTTTTVTPYLSQLARKENDLATNLNHQLGHVWGITSSVNQSGGYYFGDITVPVGSDNVTRWDACLWDTVNNRPGDQNLTISLAGVAQGNVNIFDATDVEFRAYTGYQTSATYSVFNDGNLTDALNGHVKVIYNIGPLCTEGNNVGGVGSLGYQYLSHIDLRNALMGDQTYVNYSFFTELELAIFQDLGYTDINRRDHYGRSYYVDGEQPVNVYNQMVVEQTAILQTQAENWVLANTSLRPEDIGWASAVESRLEALKKESTFFTDPKTYLLNNGDLIIESNSPYAALNADGTYNMDAGNSTPYGVGMHLFANNLNIRQRAALLADGEGAAGIRIDGSNNAISIESSVRVTANGNFGVGLLTAYGSNTRIVQRGSVSARPTGENYQDVIGGIGAWFDFGIPGKGDVRGSYFTDPATGGMFGELTGPMVLQYDLSGNLEGAATLVETEIDAAAGVTSKYFYGAALYIGETAHVQEINVMNSTVESPVSIRGNILSFYNPEAAKYRPSLQHLITEENPSALSELTTTLTFGHKMATEDRVSDDMSTISMAGSKSPFPTGGKYGDENFDFTFSDNINMVADKDADGNDITIATVGKIDLEFVGGVTRFHQNQVLANSAVVKEDATLRLTKTDVGTDTLLYLRDTLTIDRKGTLTGTGNIYTGTQISRPTTNQAWGQVVVNTAPQTVKNNGTISPGQNDGQDIGQLNIFGHLEFGRNSHYVVDIGNNRNDMIYVTGAATLDGLLEIRENEERPRVDRMEYTIMRASTIDGNFAMIETPDIGFFEFSDVIVERESGGRYRAYLSAFRDTEYFRKRALTYNEMSTATAIDNAFYDAPDILYSLGNSRNSAETLREIYNQIGSAYRANSALMNLWSPSEVLFPKIGWGTGRMETGGRGRVDWERIYGRTSKMLRGQAPGSPTAHRYCGLWADFTHTAFMANSDGNSAKYKYDRSGFMVGAELNLTPYSSLGAVMGYTDTKLTQVLDRVDSDDYILGLYFACAPADRFEFKSYIGLGFQEYDLQHRIQNADILTEVGREATQRGIFDKYRGQPNGNSFNLSLELARPLELHKTFILRPSLGFDFQHVWQDGYTEYVESTVNPLGGLYALRYHRMRYDRALLRAGFSSETTGGRGGLRMRAFYVTNMGDDNYPVSWSNFVAGGDKFDIRGVRLGNNYLNLGIGGHIWLDGERTSSVFFDYNADIYNSSHKTYVHLVNVGLQLNF